MSDVQTEEIVAEGEKYPSILDEVTDAQLEAVQGQFRKQEPLKEGPFAGKHNGWKRKEIEEYLNAVPNADAFILLGTTVEMVQSARLEQPEGPFSEAIIKGISEAFTRVPAANESVPVADAA